jgi:hypothetical protein
MEIRKIHEAFFDKSAHSGIPMRYLVEIYRFDHIFTYILHILGPKWVKSQQKKFLDKMNFPL